MSLLQVTAAELPLPCSLPCVSFACGSQLLSLRRVPCPRVSPGWSHSPTGVPTVPSLAELELQGQSYMDSSTWSGPQRDPGPAWGRQETRAPWSSVPSWSSSQTLLSRPPDVLCPVKGRGPTLQNRTLKLRVEQGCSQRALHRDRRFLTADQVPRLRVQRGREVLGGAVRWSEAPGCGLCVGPSAAALSNSLRTVVTSPGRFRNQRQRAPPATCLGQVGRGPGGLTA